MEHPAPGGDRTANREDALEDLAFLSRSANRVRILDALAAEPATRRALADATDVSRTTLDRIVNELEERGWAERRSDGQYAATAVGRHVHEALQPALDGVVAVHRLGRALDWLPRDDHPIPLEHFSDAHVRHPDDRDPVETSRYFARLASEVDELTVLSEWVPPESLGRAMHREIVDGELDADFVVTHDAARKLMTEATRRERWEEMLESTASTWLVDRSIPCNLFVFDDTVLVKASGPEGVRESYGVPIESTNPRVREWALALVDSYRETATPLELDALSA